MERFGLFAAFVIALVVALGATGAPAHAAEVGYTDGTQCQGPFCPGLPPPTDPVWAQGQECKIDIVDPPSFVYVTEHFVYGTTPPPAGVVPVVADAYAVFPYHGEAPAMFEVDISAQVAGKQGFRADTWNIGKGVTGWVPFDCRTPETTTTTSTVEPTTTTSTTVEGATVTTSSSSTTTTSIESLGSTTTSIEPLGTTTSSIGNLGTTTTVAGAARGSLPFTGGGGGLISFALITLGTGFAFVLSARRRRAARG